MLVSRTAADIEAAKAKITSQYNFAARCFPLDLSDSKSVDILAAECPETDLLVNNAGAIPRGNIAKMDEARWRTVWDLKVFGYVNMTRRFCALMAARKKGVIINIIGAVGESVQSDYRLLRERLPDGVHPGHGWHRTPRRAAGRRHQPRPGRD